MTSRENQEFLRLGLPSILIRRENWAFRCKTSKIKWKEHCDKRPQEEWLLLALLKANRKQANGRAIQAIRSAF